MTASTISPTTDLRGAVKSASSFSGNIETSRFPVSIRTTRDLALRTHSGWLLSGTNQIKNWKATTTIRNPRNNPNANPSVLSTGLIRLFKTMRVVRAARIRKRYQRGKKDRARYIAEENFTAEVCLCERVD